MCNWGQKDYSLDTIFLYDVFCSWQMSGGRKISFISFGVYDDDNRHSLADIQRGQSPLTLLFTLESRPTTSKPTNIEIKRPVLPRNNSTVSNASEVSNVSLWTSGSVSPCEHCGRRLGDTAQKGEREAQAHL